MLLVCMPFGPVFSPSLGLSLLKASLRANGIAVDVRYFSIAFAELIGQRLYDGIADGRQPPVVDLPGEWMFSRALGPSPLDEQYPDRILRQRGAWADPALAPVVTEATIRGLLDARERVDGFLSRCVDEIAAIRPAVVGFSSVFQQHVASLALARRLKARLPETVIVVGGANCEEAMGAETVRQFPFVDAAVSGEGEVVFPELVRRLEDGRGIGDLPGVYTARSAGRALAFRSFSVAAGVRSLDDLPYPDFGDYMEQFAASRFGGEWTPNIPFETSRGCWWGAKHHCTFCGLNGSSMAFRSKSPGRALEELTALTSQHAGCDIQVVDNILDMGYFQTVLPELARRSSKPALFYETKANLRKDQIRLLRAAGVTSIQPGIESFSDEVLRLMRKGVSSLQNVQLLKWCKELGVQPIWNVIWGFPGEPEGDYARMTSLVRRLTHLPPPDTFDGLRLDRFSPNFADAERLGFSGVAPLESYRYVYALPQPAIANLAYFFRFEAQGRVAYAAPLLAALRAWRRNHRRSDLFFSDAEERLTIQRVSPRRRRLVTHLRGADRVLYLACDRVRAFPELSGEGRRHGCADDADVRARLAALVDHGLMIEEGDKYLALATPRGERAPSTGVRRTRAVRRPSGAGVSASPRVRSRSAPPVGRHEAGHSFS